MRYTSLVLAITATLLSARLSFAADQTNNAGVGGISTHVPITGGSGRSSEDGLAHPGIPIKQYVVGRGIPEAGGHTTSIPAPMTGSISGMGKPITAGIGRGTMETVPGRSKTYISIVAGTQMATQSRRHQPLSAGSRLANTTFHLL